MCKISKFGLLFLCFFLFCVLASFSLSLFLASCCCCFRHRWLLSAHLYRCVSSSSSSYFLGSSLEMCRFVSVKSTATNQQHILIVLLIFILCIFFNMLNNAVVVVTFYTLSSSLHLLLFRKNKKKVLACSFSSLIQVAPSWALKT